MGQQVKQREIKSRRGSREEEMEGKQEGWPVSCRKSNSDDGCEVAGGGKRREEFKWFDPLSSLWRPHTV